MNGALGLYIYLTLVISKVVEDFMNEKDLKQAILSVINSSNGMPMSILLWLKHPRGYTSVLVQLKRAGVEAK